LGRKGAERKKEESQKVRKYKGVLGMGENLGDLPCRKGATSLIVTSTTRVTISLQRINLITVGEKPA
jgi:hypothetical protein